MGTTVSSSLTNIRDLVRSNPALTIAGGRNLTNSHMTAKNIIIPQAHQQLNDMSHILSANQYPLPEAVTIQVASAAGVGAAATTVFVLNQSDLNDVTNNGSGAATIAYTYQDGFAGRNLSNILGFARQGIGAICYGFSIRMNVTASGAGDAAGLATANPAFLTFNAFSRSLPLDLAGTMNQVRSDQDDSIMVWSCVQNLSKFTQLAFTLPVADTATVTLYMTPNFKI